jgi:hypothetical protein
VAGKAARVEYRPPAGDAVLTGCVLSGGKPVAWPKVAIRYRDARGDVLELRAETRKDGGYRFEGLPTGEARLTVSPGRLRRDLAIRPGENLQDVELPT